MVDFLNAVERVGSFPDTLSVSQLGFIPKPKGGVRGIALYSFLVRLWIPARKPVLGAWVFSFADRSYFAFSEGIGAADTVWVQAVRVEAVPLGFSSVVLFDPVSFFDNVSIDVLDREVVCNGFPISLV